MKNKFTLLATIILTSVAINAQTIKGEVTMGAAYANDVYYGLADQSTNSVNRSDWDISFYRKSNMSTGIRVNDGAGIQVYEASNDLSKWNAIDVANLSSWTALWIQIGKRGLSIMVLRHMVGEIIVLQIIM